MFAIDTTYGRLEWDGRFDGEPSLVELAQRAVAEGQSVHLIETGPSVVCGNRPEIRAWATALWVCAFLGVTPAVIAHPTLPDTAAQPEGAVQ